MSFKLTDEQKLEFINEVLPELDAKVAIGMQQHFLSWEVKEQISKSLKSIINKKVIEIAEKELEKRNKEIEEKILKKLESIIDSIPELLPSIVFNGYDDKRKINEIIIGALDSAKNRLYEINSKLK